MKTKFNTIEEQQLYALRFLLSKYNCNRKELASALDVNLGTVNQWFKRGRISAQKAIQADTITNGIVPKKFMRPDVKDWI